MSKICGAPRGFTLMELLVSLTVLTVLSMAAAPSFLAAHESLQVTRATEEVQLFLAMVKSEAVMRNKEVKIYVENTSSWILKAKVKEVDEHGTKKEEEISRLDGSNFAAITLEPTKADGSLLKADPVRGVLSSSGGRSGGLKIFKVPTRTAEVSYSRATGRIRICSKEGAYGYDKC